MVQNFKREGNVIDYEVAISQSIDKGDFVKINADGNKVQVATAGDAILGVSESTIRTDASGNVLGSHKEPTRTDVIDATRPAIIAVRRTQNIYATVVGDNAVPIKIGDELEIESKNKLEIKTGGTAVAIAEEFIPIQATPINNVVEVRLKTY